MPHGEKKETNKAFQFKQFAVAQDRCTMKVGTDGVLLGAWCDTQDAQHILDIGTGTGVIALMLAQRNEAAQVRAVEIDETAHQQAQENFDASPFATRMESILMSIQDYAKKTETAYDLIVSNPPFFTGGTFSNNENKNNVRHTVKLPHGDLLLSTRKLLSAQGKFCVVLPSMEGLRFVEVARTYHFYCTKITEVRPKPDKGIERLLLQFELEEKPCIKDELIIQKDDKRNDYTEDYKALTEAFYTIF